MRKIHIVNIVILTIALFQGTLCDTPGLSMSIEESVLEQAKEAYLGFIIDIINNQSLSDITFDNGYLKSNDFSIKQSPNNVNFTFNAEKTSVKFDVKKLTVWFRSNDFYYKKKLIPIHGFVDASFAEASLSIEFQLTNQTDSQGRYLPAVSVTSQSFSISADKISIDLGGSFLVNMADIVLPLFRNQIKNKLQTYVNDLLKTKVQSYMNNIVSGMDGYANVDGLGNYSNITIDYALEEPWNMTSSYLGAAINATVFNKGNYSVPPITQVNLPFKNSSLPSKLQTFASNYFLESALHTYFDITPIDFSIMASMIPTSFAYQMNTTTFDALIPAMASTYGRDVPVDAYVKVVKIYRFDVQGNASAVQTKADVHIKCIVHYDNGTQVDAGTIIAPNTDIYFKIKVSGMRLTAEIDKAQVIEMYVNSTKYGYFKASNFLPNMGFKIALPIVNTYLASTYYYDIPTNVFNIFELSDVDIQYFDHYLQIGLTPKFVKKVSSQSMISLQQNYYIDQSDEIKQAFMQ